MRDPTKIRGFRNVSTSHQAVFITAGGEAKISQISPRRWKVLPRGGEAYEVSGKQEAIEEARGISSGLTPSHVRTLQERQRALQSSSLAEPTKKSSAQIKCEVDEILAGNPATAAAPKRQIPGIAAWNMFAGGTGATAGKHAYSLHVPEGEYHVSPVSSQHGRHRGYSLMFAARQQPRGSHGGLWHDLGMHRSPAKAAVGARKHYEAAY